MLKKHLALFFGVFFTLAGIIVTGFILVALDVSSGQIWMFPAIIVPIVLAIVLLVYYFRIKKKIIGEIKKIPIVQKVLGKGSLFYYNHMIKTIPQLEGVVIDGSTEEPTLVYNSNFEAGIDNFRLDARQVKGVNLLLTYKEKKFIFTNEYVRKRRVARHDSKGRRVHYDIYYTFINALLSIELSGEPKELFYITRKKAASKPANFKLFESESIEFNNKISTFYNGDDIGVFQKFNPLVIDGLNNTDLSKFSTAYANESGIINFSSDEIKDNNQRVLNSIFGIQLTGRRFMEDLDRSFKRFEGNLSKLSKKLSIIKPFYH